MICLRAREESCCCVVALRIHYRSNRETLSCDKMWIRRRNILKWCWKGYRSVWMKRQSAVCPKHPPSVRYCGTVWRFVRLHTDPPSTWQMTHFSLGCYFQMVHRDEHGEKWRKWVKKMWGRKVREFRQRRNEGLWYMGRQDRGCVCEPSTPPSSTNPGGNFTFEERIRSERDKNKSHINYSGVRECIWMCVIPESGPVILYGLWWSALGLFFQIFFLECDHCGQQVMLASSTQRFTPTKDTARLPFAGSTVLDATEEMGCKVGLLEKWPAALLPLVLTSKCLPWHILQVNVPLLCLSK